VSTLPTGIGTALLNLGEVSLRRREYQHASGYLRQALALFREAGDQEGEIEALQNLAKAVQGDSQTAAARVEMSAALRLAAETGNTYQEASAHGGLAESHHCAGEDEQARHHGQQALTLYAQFGAPEADQVQSRLVAQEAKNNTDPAD
jgi:tetratricopeptide (TPR) repeat protein